MGINKTNYTDYSLKTLHAILPVLDELRTIAAEYPDTIIERDNEANIIRFGKINTSKFYFFVNPGLEEANKPAFFTTYCNPHSEDDNEGGQFHTAAGHIVNLFKAWISLLFSYDTYLSRLSPEDSIQNAYQKEFIEHFALLDDTAEYEPFPLDIQVKLIEFLTHMEDRLNAIEEKTEEVKSILAQTTKLKDEVPNLTKAQTVTRLSKIWAWTRKAGFKVFNKVFDVVVEEAVKSVFDGRALLLIHMAQQVHH